jgi:hypothetical protein
MKNLRQRLGLPEPKKDVLSLYIGSALWSILFFGVVIGLIGDLLRNQVLLKIASIMAMTFFVIVIVCIGIIIICGIAYGFFCILERTTRHEED